MNTDQFIKKISTALGRGDRGFVIVSPETLRRAGITADHLETRLGSAAVIERNDAGEAVYVTKRVKGIE